MDGGVAAFGAWLPVRRVKAPALGPVALGSWIGMEYAIVDTASGAVPETTQAFWFYIEK